MLRLFLLLLLHRFFLCFAGLFGLALLFLLPLLRLFLLLLLHRFFLRFTCLLRLLLLLFLLDLLLRRILLRFTGLLALTLLLLLLHLSLLKPLLLYGFFLDFTGLLSFGLLLLLDLRLLLHRFILRFTDLIRLSLPLRLLRRPFFCHFPSWLARRRLSLLRLFVPLFGHHFLLLFDDLFSSRQSIRRSFFLNKLILFRNHDFFRSTGSLLKHRLLLGQLRLGWLNEFVFDYVLSQLTGLPRLLRTLWLFLTDHPRWQHFRIERFFRLGFSNSIGWIYLLWSDLGGLLRCIFLTRNA